MSKYSVTFNSDKNTATVYEDGADIPSDVEVIGDFYFNRKDQSSQMKSIRVNLIVNEIYPDSNNLKIIYVDYVEPVEEVSDEPENLVVTEFTDPNIENKDLEPVSTEVTGEPVIDKSAEDGSEKQSEPEKTDDTPKQETPAPEPVVAPVVPSLFTTPAAPVAEKTEETK